MPKFNHKITIKISKNNMTKFEVSDIGNAQNNPKDHPVLAIKNNDIPK